MHHLLCFAVSAAAAKPESTEQLAWNAQVDAVRKLYKHALWEFLSPELVLMFWSLSYSDIHCPTAR